MSLTWCPDVSHAAWLTAGETPTWQQLICFGPADFADYARLRFIPDPTSPGQREGDVEDDVIPESEAALARGVLDVLAGHTTTPDDCFFCLWEGWGPTLHGRDGLRTVDWATGTVTRGPDMEPAFGREVLDGPTVSLPHRNFYLFRGRLADFGDWGAADYRPGMPRTDMPNPAFVWPADHAWCVADDVDPHWAGIGASAAAIEELLAVPDLDIVRADPAAPQPHYW